VASSVVGLEKGYGLNPDQSISTCCFATSGRGRFLGRIWERRSIPPKLRLPRD